MNSSGAGRLAEVCAARMNADGHPRCLCPANGAATQRQTGSISLLLVLTLLLMLGFTGLALDTARVYNRRAELQGVADAAALAAARELNGTAAGVNAAVSKAAAVVNRFKYAYDRAEITWNDSAIEFSSSPAPNGAWKSSGSAASAPTGVYYVKVDTSQLNADAAAVQVVFMRIIGADLSPTSVIGRAIAGRSGIKVTPLAVCAMSTIPASPRTNAGPPPNVELVEYGFRRGVGYDLMKLNPGATTPANFLVNPIDPPGSVGSPVHTTTAIVGPFICTGTMAMTKVTGAPIRVDSPFPLEDFYRHFNSRFDQYDGSVCSPNGAPPDVNIKPYIHNTGVPWMTTVPGGQTAASLAQGSVLHTVADPDPSPSGTTAAQYGPLWSFARAVPFSAYAPGLAEPVAGYTPFNTAAWSTLYRPGQPVATSYPSVTPYISSAAAYSQSPSIAHRPGKRYRRVLNIPLLSCPVSGVANTPATVLAVGKFFMTVPATPTSLSAEFAGAIPAESLVGPVELFPL